MVEGIGWTSGGRHCKFSFPFYFLYILFLSFFILVILFLSLTAINCLMFVSRRNIVVSFVDRCLVFKFGGIPGLFHTSDFPSLLVMYFYSTH
jgi:hypothetical protein